MNLPMQIDDRCSYYETKEEVISVCRACRRLFNKTEFAAYRFGEQTGYSDELGAYCKSYSEKCEECDKYFARGSFDDQGICFCCVIWGKWSTV